MQEVLRREEKFLLKQIEAYTYIHRFGAVMARDPYSRKGSYLVRSLYFDTLDNRDFFDKVNEQELRKKIRLRIYDPKDGTAKLERKQKQNLYQRKQSLTISREDAQQMMEGNYRVLLNYHTPFADEIYATMTRDMYRPKTIVSYQREAFMAKENRIRLTFDSQIRSSETDLDLFSPSLPLMPAFDPDQVVLEVKYDQFMLSYIKDVLKDVDRTAVTASKYCAGRGITLPLWL